LADPPLFIGIDGGGTQCRARIRDGAGRIVGEGAGGPANARLHAAAVMANILAAARAAAQAAGLAEADLQGAHAGFGLAGANLKSAVAQLLAEPHPFATVAVETDAYVAWLGAHAGRDGAILILGTGSCGFAAVGGRQLYVSGWGAEVSDEASGMWIGREAVRRTLWAYDGRAASTPLSDALFARLGGTAENFVAFATTARPADYGRFVPLVLDHADRRDPLALAILAEAAADAARIATRLLDAGAPTICLLGGLAEAIAGWLPPPIKARLAPARGDALDGALLMAERAAANSGSPVGERIAS